MKQHLCFDTMRDGIIHGTAYQGACQRYAHGNGSSEAIAMAVLSAIGFPDLYIDAMRYRYLRDKCLRDDRVDLDAVLDGEMDALSATAPDRNGGDHA